MKKIILAICIIFFTAGLSVYAQEPAKATPLSTGDDQANFWYYPATNTYYNEASSEYLYYDDVSSTWLTVKKLPLTIVVEPASTKYTVSYNGNEVWKDNDLHKAKFKVKKDGTVKEKPKN